MDTEPIPTEPTTDPEPPDVTSLTPGPSQAPTSPAAGRGRRTVLIGAVVGLALVVMFSAGIGVGRLVLPALGGATGDDPEPCVQPPADRLRPDPGSLGHAPQRSTWARDDLDDRALIYGAINGMTEAVGDTGHTDFMTPEERAARDERLSGSYVGIGVRIDAADDGLPLIVGVFKDSPAEKAGVKVGDEIVKVDGKSTDGQTSTRSPAGSAARPARRSR